MGLLDALQGAIGGTQAYIQQNVVSPVASVLGGASQAAQSTINTYAGGQQAVQRAQQQQREQYIRQEEAREERRVPMPPPERPQVMEAGIGESIARRIPSVISGIQTGMKPMTQQQGFVGRMGTFGENVVTGTKNIFQTASEEATKRIEAVPQPQFLAGAEKGVVGIAVGAPMALASAMLAPGKAVSDITSSQRYWDPIKQKSVSKIEYELRRTARETPEVLASPMTDIRQSGSYEEAFGKSLAYTGGFILGARGLPSVKTLRSAGITTPSEAVVASGRAMLGLKLPEPIIEGAYTPVKTRSEPIMGKEYTVLKGIRQRTISQEVPEAIITPIRERTGTPGQKMFGTEKTGISELEITPKPGQRTQAYPIFEKVPVAELSESEILGAIKAPRFKVGVEVIGAGTEVTEFGATQRGLVRGKGLVELAKKAEIAGKPSQWEIAGLTLGKMEKVTPGPAVTEFEMFRTANDFFLGRRVPQMDLPFGIPTEEMSFRMKPVGIIKPQIEVAEISAVKKGRSAKRRALAYKPETIREKTFGASPEEIQRKAWAQSIMRDVSDPFVKNIAEQAKRTAEEQSRIAETAKIFGRAEVPSGTKTKTKARTQEAVSMTEIVRRKTKQRGKVIIEEEVHVGTRKEFTPPRNLEQMNREFQKRIQSRELGMSKFVTRAERIPLRTAVFAGLSLQPTQSFRQTIDILEKYGQGQGVSERTAVVPSLFQITPTMIPPQTKQREETITIIEPTYPVPVETVPEIPPVIPRIPVEPPIIKVPPPIPFPMFGGGGLGGGQEPLPNIFTGKELKLHGIPSPEELMGFGNIKSKFKVNTETELSPQQVVNQFYAKKKVAKPTTSKPPQSNFLTLDFSGQNKVTKTKSKSKGKGKEKNFLELDI